MVGSSCDGDHPFTTEDTGMYRFVDVNSHYPERKIPPRRHDPRGLRPILTLYVDEPLVANRIDVSSQRRDQ
ncbi:unnamed protein product [Lupinus luteus]|uniref:Uncharacterized protein n=1 Tax=Lupinus luteus TaxID=3873 RepID=A0AAV1YHL2_LUPLU